MFKSAIVLGGGGFIGNHIVSRLKSDGYFVKAVDLKYPEFSKSQADEFIIGDLRDPNLMYEALSTHKFDEIYQLAADMGGAGYINTGNNDADVMSNSVLINVNALSSAHKLGLDNIIFSSTACVYPEYNQLDPDNVNCREDSVYPAQPDTEYGWEKLFSERLYLAYNKNHGMKNKIVRYHNVFGPLGTWDGGKEKAPAAICRKVAQAYDEIEIWGNGEQGRSFLYIDECVEGTIRVARSESFLGPVNIGSERMITINQLVEIVAGIANKTLVKKHIPGPIGVHARMSNNDLIFEKLGWKPEENLEYGLQQTFKWIKEMVNNNE